MMEFERNADWLAAYAVGLAYSMRPATEAVDDLRVAAGTRPELLGDAWARVQDLSLPDADMCRHAASLLAAAAGMIAATGWSPVT